MTTRKENRGDEMALRIAQLRSNLLAAGWKVLTSDAWVIARLGGRLREECWQKSLGTDPLSW